ncbi:MAG: hypothetical protein CSA66_00315 [Proteobacteria bacterium]|nr:MAG: hypothetical protein CSA66_00315 [Pseudomonadota bacterium]
MSFADAHKDAVLERVAVEPAVSGHALCEAITYVADDAVITACEEALRRAPLGEGGGGADGPRVLPERWAVMALGGYGRGQMCLRSDVDIQLVVPDGSADPGPFMVALLDHLTRHRLKTGHGVRTLSESLMLSRTEYTFATATLTARHLIGDPTVTEAVRAPVYHHLSGPGLASLVEALEIDREKRIRRHGDTVYLLEPDLKQGVGGLRDAQLVGWLGLVTGRIYDRAVMLAEDLLLKVRQVVHAVATFKCDRLAFEYQDEVADRLGLRAAPGEDPSVELMRQVHLAMRLLDGRARRHLEYARGRVQAPRRRRLVGHPGFVQLGGRLARADGAPPRTAAEAVEAVEAAARTGLPFEAGLEDGLETVARRLGPGGRESPQLNGLLLDLLLSPTTEASAALHLLHHTGLLTAVVPEFAPVQGRINRDLYHVFTVDEHILAVVDKLKAIGRGDHSDDHPLATRAWAHLDAERRPLVVAALLHDVGKGYGPGHHERGAELATQVAPRLGLTATENPRPRRRRPRHPRRAVPADPRRLVLGGAARLRRLAPPAPRQPLSPDRGAPADPRPLRRSDAPQR